MGKFTDKYIKSVVLFLQERGVADFRESFGGEGREGQGFLTLDQSLTAFCHSGQGFAFCNVNFFAHNSFK